MIESIPDLSGALKSIEGEKRIGFDLEADSMYHFSEKVCLLQVASKNAAFAVDTLKIRDLSLFKPLFLSRDIVKVFHGADYDVRSLFRDFGIEIRNLFDTELASRFLGVKETGLEAVLKNRFCVKLEKKFQKKDWSERPLSGEMLEYALNDVRHLVALSEILERELEEKGRLSWVREECDILCSMRAAENNGEPLFVKFKGAGNLDSRTLAVLEELLEMRRKTAQKKDRPPFKIIGNNSILKLAEEKPVTLKEIDGTGALSRRQSDMYGQDIAAAVRKALEMPEKMLPAYPRRKVASIPESALKRIKSLKAWRDRKAANLNIDPGLVLNKSLISRIGYENPFDSNQLRNMKDMKNWQRREFGEDIVKVLKRRR